MRKIRRDLLNLHYTVFKLRKHSLTRRRIRVALDQEKMPSRHSPETNTPHRTLWSGWLAALLTLLWSVASRPNEQQWPLVERTSDLVWAVAQFHSPSFQTCPFHIRLFSVSWPWPWIRWIHFHWRRDDDGQSERGRRKNKFLLLRKWNIFQTGISKCLENANEEGVWEAQLGRVIEWTIKWDSCDMPG